MIPISSNDCDDDADDDDENTGGKFFMEDFHSRRLRFFNV